MSTDIRDIPGLSVRPLHVPLRTTSVGGLPQVRLPSGHVATHVTRYPDVRAVLSDPTFLRACTNTDDGPSYLPTTMPPEMLLNLDMPDHARLKRLTNRLYSAAAMAASRESVDATVAELTSGRETFDLVRDVLVPLTVRVNCTLLGIEHEEIPRFHELSVEMQMAPRDDVDHLRTSFVELYGYIAELATTHRTRDDGLIAALLDQGSALEEPLTREEASAILLGSLARLVITATVEHLVTHLPTLRLDAAAETIAWETGVLVHRPRSLPVVNVGAADVAA